MVESKVPTSVQTYLAEIVERLTNLLGVQLVGVYLFGSAGYGAFEPGLSDLDVQVVVKNPLDDGEKKSLVGYVNHDALPCPATKLELVVYAQDPIRPASRHPRFELNLNTGAQQADHVSFDPAGESSHWFLLDIAMGRQLGRALYGMPPDEVFGAVPRLWTLEAIMDSLAWHQANEVNSANSVLNACRSWHFIETGEFSSKSSGAQWTMRHHGYSDIIGKALAGRKTGDKLDTDQVMALYEAIREAGQV